MQFLVSSEVMGGCGGRHHYILLPFLVQPNSVSQIIDPQEQDRMGSKLPKANSLSAEFLNHG